LEWDVKNNFTPSGEIASKTFWHTKYPKVYYPHFYPRWLTHDLTAEGFKESTASDVLDIEPIWPDFKSTYGPRANDLISLLEVGNTNLLFLRVEEPRLIDRLVKMDVQQEAEYLIAKVSQTFSQATIGLLYIYIDFNECRRLFTNTGRINFFGVPQLDYERAPIEIMKRLKLTYNNNETKM
jgi:hypothetical protein